MILTKLLSPNDTGETKSHQAGMHIPKVGGYLNFFPRLDGSKLNPDALLTFEGPKGTSWEFRFVYYNNRKFGGTRDEYRLARMTRFLRSVDARSGDGVVLSRGHEGAYRIDVVRSAVPNNAIKYSRFSDDDGADESSQTIELVFDKDWNLITDTDGV